VATAPPPITVQAPGGLAFNLIFDASVASAPAGFESGMTAACLALSAIFTNPITVTLDVGWGEINGAPLSGNDSEGSGLGFFYSYQQVVAALTASATSADDLTALANLPAVDPTAGGRFLVFNAEATALGLLRHNTGMVDGSVGFSAASNYTFDPNDRAVPGAIDFIGVAEHEITHAMGRISGLGQPDYSILDLFRYSSRGALELTQGTPAFFSIDGGDTNLNQFSTTVDPSDWAASAGNDAFDAVAVTGTEEPLTATDIREMNVLGFDLRNVFSGATETGIDLADAATQNPQTITAAAYVTSPGDALVGEAGFAWTVANAGEITAPAGVGVHLLSGGYVGNAAGATIVGATNGIEIDAASGTVVNYGAITATGSSGYADGIALGLGAVTNFGTVEAPGSLGSGIVLGAGGTVINGPQGAYGALIQGGLFGVYVTGAAATLTNYATITGHYGVVIAAGYTTGSVVTNAGAIIGYGGTAVIFESRGRMIVDPGAVFGGIVTAAAGTLELAAGAGPGRLSGIGAYYAGFGAIQVDAGARWNLSGDATGSRVANDGVIVIDNGGTLVFRGVREDSGDRGVIALAGGGVAEFEGAVASGQRLVFRDATGLLQLAQPQSFRARIVGFRSGDTIDLVGVPADGFTLSGSQLQLTEQGSPVASLNFAGNFTAAAFRLGGDGNGGTDITLAALASRGEPLAPATAHLPAFWAVPG
jgi:hypothetical protein